MRANSRNSDKAASDKQGKTYAYRKSESMRTNLNDIQKSLLR